MTSGARRACRSDLADTALDESSAFFLGSMGIRRFPTGRRAGVLRQSPAMMLGRSTDFSAFKVFCSEALHGLRSQGMPLPQVPYSFFLLAAIMLVAKMRPSKWASFRLNFKARTEDFRCFQGFGQWR